MPDDQDEPYFIDYQIKIDKNDKITGAPLKEVEKFRFAISTKRLLYLAAEHARVIQADSTYKLIWNGNPVLIVGFTDQENTFHPVCLAVTTDETNNDYHFLFKSIVKGVERLGKQTKFFTPFFNQPNQFNYIIFKILH